MPPRGPRGHSEVLPLLTLASPPWYGASPATSTPERAAKVVQKHETKADFAALCGVTKGAITRAMKNIFPSAVVGDRINTAHPAAIAYRARQLVRTAPPAVVPPPGSDELFVTAHEICEAAGRWTASTIMRGLKTGYTRAARIHEQLQAAGYGTPPELPVGPTDTPTPPKTPAGRQAARPSSRRAAPADGDLGGVEADVEAPEDLGEIANWTVQAVVDKFGTRRGFIDWLKALRAIEDVHEKRIKNAQLAGRLVSRRLVATGVIDVFNSANVRLMTDGAKAITAATAAKRAGGESENEIEAHVADLIGSFIRPVKSKIERNLASATPDDV